MEISLERLKELCVRPGFIQETQFELAAKEAQAEHIPLDRFLVEKGLMQDENLGKAIADAFNYHFIDLKKVKIDEKFLHIIPELVARAQQAIVVEQTKDGLRIATSDPENFEFLKFLEKKTGENIQVSYATPWGIEEALRYYKKGLGEKVKSLLEDLRNNPQNQQNIVQLVDLLLEYAYDNRASDIHIEPLIERVSVRFRIDGILHEVVSYPKELHERIVFRIKILSRLRTDEHAAAQDGRIDYKKNHAQFDVRVSILPVSQGENVVLRLLSERSLRLTLEELGLLEGDLQKIKRGILKPYGMILAVGPTGSGKTTTLYALLQILNKPEVNIMTIEDPIEYHVEHVQQTQVHPAKNLTFATGLKSIIRQDPNIIMVGEIRDNETAKIAVNAAMTGHLLLSTLHANDAATTFPRLIEMGIEPFLVASSLNLVIAQRLVRKICENCRMSYFLNDEERKALEAEPVLIQYLKEISGKKDLPHIRVYKGSGCKICNDTGYRGRTGIFEGMEVGEEIRMLIVQKATARDLYKKAQELGMVSMVYDGLVKVFQGITTLQELIRVTKT